MDQELVATTIQCLSAAEELQSLTSDLAEEAVRNRLGSLLRDAPSNSSSPSSMAQELSQQARRYLRFKS